MTLNPKKSKDGGTHPSPHSFVTGSEPNPERVGHPSHVKKPPEPLVTPECLFVHVSLPICMMNGTMDIYA